MNRKIWMALLTIIFLVAVLPAYAFARDVHVRGYFRKDGTYVQPHYRSAPDGNPYNNYSFPGNVNPYTGKVAPGNPDTYLERYYNKNSTGITSGASSAGQRVLRFGNQGFDVALLQRCLLSHGFNTGLPDGIIGQKTRQAIIAFQRTNKLKQDGIAGPLTIGKLKSSSNNAACAALNGR